jgi:tRNA A-37 threonylcarbamoyl transferase component Bud32
VPASGVDRVDQMARRVIAASARLNTIALVTAAALTVLGAWAYTGVAGSLREIRAAGLQTVLDAEINALHLWVENRKAHVENWANDARVRRLAVELAALGRREGVSGEALWDSPARARLAEMLGPVLQGAGAVAFNVVDTGGRIVGTQFRDYSGRKVNPGSFLAHLYEVFAGRAQFVRPFREQDRVEGARAGTFGRPVVWFKAPVTNERGEVVAALGFAYPAEGEFANILNVARPGKTGEAYAFDENGLMLSESRFVRDLRRIGLVPDNSGASAMLRVHVRDPGGDLAAGHKPAVEWAALPLTRLAALAVASRAKADAEERHGVLVEPYRNYRGVEVVGAWRWLPDYDMGLTIELSAKEAYAPLVYLSLAFAIILSLLLAAVGAVLWSAWNVRRLKREVGEERVIGQYRLERQIGEGGMSKVFLARHELLKRPTALKMLKPHLASDEIVARFEREVQLASQLVHPNTIEIYDYGRTREGVFYYVMEYLEGETLDQLVDAHGPLPVERTVHVLRQVCAALREAHGRGLIHRDIKPHNIMLCQRGGEYDVAKILDFGLVKDVIGRQSRDITQFQRVVGTPLYMSPERVRNPGDADARSDIYSVGAVGFFLLTGRSVFDSTTEHDLTYHILHTPARRASELVPGVPRRLDELIARCLAKERTERPHDVLVVLALLEALSVAHVWTQRAAAAWWKAHRVEGQPAAAAT